MRIFLILIFTLLSCSTFYGQQDTVVERTKNVFDTSSTLQKVEFDRERISDFKKDDSFNYIYEIENDSWWTRFKRWLSLKYNQFMEWLFGDYTANSLVAAFLLILPYIFVAVIIGLIVWLFIRLNPGPSLLGDPETGSVSFNEEEEIVRSQDISSLIESAIKDKDYRLAVRYYYLQLLKHLNEKGLIHYEFQKTNSEYLAEINEESYKPTVKKLMRLYDFIWYGSFSVSENDFAIAQNSFREIENSILNLPNEK